MIAQQSKEFLIDLFSGLRDDLDTQMRSGGRGRPDPEKAARDRAMYEALLVGLTGFDAFPDDEALLEYVSGLAKATDEENEYEQAALEHRAFKELRDALAEIRRVT